MKNSDTLKAIYFTTPFCGVCQTARPVVKVLTQVLNIPLEERDANHNKEMLESSRISQVPALVILQDDRVIYHTDVIKDVTTMYEEILKQLA